MNVKFWGRHNTSPRKAAVCFMLLSTAAFSLMNIGVRLAAETMEATLIVTLRNFVTLLMLLPLVAPDRFAIVRTRRLGAHFWRSAIGAIGMITWTYCLTIMPLVHATALSFTAPLLATLFAIGILKEHASWRHWLALALGFTGVLVILRPGLAGFELHSLWVIFATTAWAITSLFIKSLSGTEPPLRMVFYMNLFMFLLALPFGLSHWRMPVPHEWFLVAGISVCSIVMHFTLVRAYALAPIVSVMPLDYMRLVYTSLLAYLILGETSDIYTWIGSAVIIASVVWISKSTRPPVPEPVA